jgi:hypothetical protein
LNGSSSRLRPEYYGRRQKVEVEEPLPVPGDGIPRARPQEIPELLASAIRYLQSRGIGLDALGLPAIETTAKRVEESPAEEEAAK